MVGGGGDERLRALAMLHRGGDGGWWGWQVSDSVRSTMQRRMSQSSTPQSTGPAQPIPNERAATAAHPTPQQRQDDSSTVLSPPREAASAAGQADNTVRAQETAEAAATSNTAPHAGAGGRRASTGGEAIVQLGRMLDAKTAEAEAAEQRCEALQQQLT